MLQFYVNLIAIFFTGNVADNVLYKRYCSIVNDRAIIPDNDALIRFVTDININTVGFEIKYEFTSKFRILKLLL